MRKSKFTEEQIVAALKLAQTSSVDEACRKLGISKQTFYSWKKKFGGMDVSDARRLKQLEEENRRLKKLVADQALDNAMLKEVLTKDSMKWPTYPREHRRERWTTSGSISEARSRRCARAVRREQSAWRGAGRQLGLEGTSANARPAASCWRPARRRSRSRMR